jgi:hypothetical protein
MKKVRKKSEPFFVYMEKNEYLCTRKIFERYSS